MSYKVYSSGYFGEKKTPVHPDFLAFDEAMQKGYMYQSQGKDRQAVDIWQDDFDQLRAHMEERDLKDLSSFDDLINGNEFVENFVQDYDESLLNILFKCSQEEAEGYARQKIQLMEYLLGLESQKEETKAMYKKALAETYYFFGQLEQGDQHFEELIQEHPDYVGGYVGYADAYTDEHLTIKDYDKALKILQRAYDRLSIEDSDLLSSRMARVMVNMEKEALERSAESGEKPLATDVAKLSRELFEAREAKMPKKKRMKKAQIKPMSVQQPLIKEKKVGVNEPCPCGSGKKYKKCCMK